MKLLKVFGRRKGLSGYRDPKGALPCPNCGSEVKLYYSDVRAGEVLGLIRARVRTRRCSQCDHKTKTVEVISDHLDLLVSSARKMNG